MCVPMFARICMTYIYTPSIYRSIDLSIYRSIDLSIYQSTDFRNSPCFPLCAFVGDPSRKSRGHAHAQVERVVENRIMRQLVEAEQQRA